MKIIVKQWMVAFVALFFTPFIYMVSADNYDNLWKKVDEAEKKNLPQTVVKLTDEIYLKALAEKQPGQMFKAYIYRESTQHKLTPDSAYTAFSYMEQWADRETDVVNKSVLHSLLASMYADYVSMNTYALRNRTDLQGEIPDDIREWTANIFIDKIDLHSQAALAGQEALLKASANQYVPFVEKEDGSKYYGHDLFHLIARRAIATYSQLSLNEADSLKETRIESTFRQMQQAYKGKNVEGAFLTDLDYWDWKEEGQERNTDFAGLDALIAQYGSNEICAEAYIRKAEKLQQSEHYTEAMLVCDEGLKKYPQYRRINALKNVRAQLFLSSLQVFFPQFKYPSDSLQLQVNYDNLKGFTAYLYQTTLKYIPQDYDADQIRYQSFILLKSEHFDLPDAAKVGIEPQKDKEATFSMAMPERSGVYLLRVIADDKPLVKMDYLASTRLQLLTQNIGDNKTELVTVDAKTGHPVGGVDITLYSDVRERYRKQVAQFSTDDQGRYVLDYKERVQAYSMSKGDDTAKAFQRISIGRSYQQPEDKEQTHVTLLTDRSIYRPGQTVYVKGLVYSQLKDNGKVIEGLTDELVLRDVNYQEVSRQQVRTNEYGSFAAQFVLPTACLNGSFTLSMEKNNGQTNLRVEEYKRPTFEITFNPIEKAYRLGDEVLLTGSAKMLNGVSLQDVLLHYTVSRSQGDYWWGRVSEPLTADSVRIDAQGNFTIPVCLTEDESEEGVGQYDYLVKVSVTEASGETQEAETHIYATAQAYQLSSNLPSFLSKEQNLSFTFGAMNLQGEPQQVQLRYRFYFKPQAAGEASKEKPVQEGLVQANTPFDGSAWKSLPSGSYLLEITLPQEDGLDEKERTILQTDVCLYAPGDRRLGSFMHIFCPQTDMEFSEASPAEFLFGTSDADAYIFMDTFGKKGRIASVVLTLDDEITSVKLPYRDEYGDGIVVVFTFVKDGQCYSTTVTLRKKRPDRQLRIRWEVFRDKLTPGQTEEWRLVVNDPQGLPVAAEMLALMYDASLDQIYKRSQGIGMSYYPYLYHAGRNYDYQHGSSLYMNERMKWLQVASLLGYDHFMDFDFFGPTRVFGMTRGNGMVVMEAMASAAPMRASKRMMADDMEVAEKESAVAFDSTSDMDEGGAELLEPAGEALRTNFAETAFFYPQLLTNEQGEIVLSFTIPESLTRWNIAGYAHTKDMMTGMLTATATTAKDFMLRPNMPRFLRVGDETQIAATVQNQSDRQQKGEVSLVLFDPVTEKVVRRESRRFDVPAGGSSTVSYRFSVPEDMNLLGVRLIANAQDFSDGEQHVLPVLSNKQYVIESVSLPMRGNQTRVFSLESLFNHHHSSATQRRLTMEFTGNPAWYAVQALPSVGQPVHDNAIDWAIAYYVNSLASHIANSQPKIQAVFNRWKNTDANKETFLSQLQKNADLKEILLSESPWVLDAQSEADQRQRISTLFDLNQMKNQLSSALVKLQGLQNADGGWSWYKGMSSSWYTTSFIVEQLVRIPRLTGASLPSQAAEMNEKAWNYMHEEMLDYYNDIQLQMKRDKNYRYEYLSGAAMDYLYLIAISHQPVPEKNRKAYDFFLARVPNNLTGTSLTRSAQSAVILKYADKQAKALEFIASLKEHLVMEDELGAHFAFLDQPYAWGMLPVPTHVAVMEAFGEFEGNDSLIEEMKIWLLKQKQTHAWNNSVATADAVYALLCTGTDLLQNQGDVRLTVGNEVVETLSPSKTIIPDLGYVKQTFSDNPKVLGAKDVKVEKRDAGIAWGAVYAQYLSPMTDVTQQGSQLNVDRKFYVERTDANGRSSLVQVNDKQRLKVGDMVVSRITISVDRSLDFVQLKDRLASCFEPLNTLSGYRWSQGIGYYVESEDAATNFFFDGLGKGVYVLESRYRIARAGTYQVGLAQMQCAYAPEFTSHSSGLSLVVED